MKAEMGDICQMTQPTVYLTWSFTLLCCFVNYFLSHD